MEISEDIDLLDNLIGMVDDNHHSDYDGALHMAIEALSEEPIKHGHWDEIVNQGMYCSECHNYFSFDDNCTEEFDYCPHCGAKMDEVSDEEK